MNIRWFDTTLGRCGLAWRDRELTGFLLPGCDLEGRQVAPLKTADSHSVGENSHAMAEAPPWVESILARVGSHLSGRPEDFSDLPFAWAAVSSFKRKVYLQTLRIASGTTSTYGAIARELGLDRDGARAVGVALGANPWPLLVPCHRVVSRDGAMTGFSGPGGIRTKTRLLVLEGAELISE